MQYKTANERINKWLNKFGGERQGELALLSKDTARAAIKAAFNTQCADESKIKIILAEAGTSRIVSPAYLNFGREVRGLFNQRIMGAQLIDAANIILNKYLARGLEQDTLEKIRNTVYSIGAPAP